MNLARWKLFLTVADCASLTKASLLLRISTPSISRQLGLLQKHYAAKLYKKTSRGIELTEAGKVLAKEFRSILSREENLKQRVRDAGQENGGSVLEVGGSDAPSVSILPVFLVRFRKNHPASRVSFRTSDSWGMERMVLSSEVEVGVVTAVSRAPLLNVELFSEEEMVAVVSAHHPLGKKARLTLDELARAPLVVRRDQVGMVETEKSINRLMRRGMKPNIVGRFESSSSLKSAVEAGIGVGFLARAMVASSVKEGALKILSVPGFRMHLKMFVIHLKDRPLSREAEDFLDLLRANKPAKRPEVSLLSPRVSASLLMSPVLALSLHPDVIYSALGL